MATGALGFLVEQVYGDGLRRVVVGQFGVVLLVAQLNQMTVVGPSVGWVWPASAWPASPGVAITLCMSSFCR